MPVPGPIVLVDPEDITIEEVQEFQRRSVPVKIMDSRSERTYNESTEEILALPRDGYSEPVAATTLGLGIGGKPAEILFRGQAAGTAGMMQINARLPEGLNSAVAVPVLLTIDGVASQAGVTLSVR